MPHRTLARRLRRWLPVVLVLPIVYLLRTPIWTPIDHRFYNYLHSKRDVGPWDDVVVVGIDDQTVASVLGRPVYPLSRHTERHAELVRNLETMGARAVVLDLRLTKEDFDAPPEDLAAAIRTAGNVYLAMSVVEKYDDQGLADIVVTGVMPHPLLVQAARGALVVEVQVDPDGVLRRFSPNPRLAPLGLETLPEHLAGVKLESSTPIVFPSLDQPLPYVSYADVIRRPDEVTGQVAGRIAFVGSILDESIDYITVPRLQRVKGGRAVFRLPGVGALAAVTETLIEGQPLRDARWSIALVWNVLWSVLAVWAMPRRRPVTSALVLVAVLGVAVMVTGLIHIKAGLVLPAGLLVGCIATCGVFALVGSYVETTKDYYEEEAENRRVHAEMKMARSTQEGFLPAALPKLQPFDIFGVNLSSLEVSGDYYDAVARDGGSVVLAIGDVKGKGMPASLLMSNVQAGLHTQLYNPHFEIQQCVSNLNRLVCDNTTPEDFVTFALVELVAAPPRLRVVRAGHELPFVVSRDGEVYKLEEGGPVLGLVPDIPFAVEERDLSPGDVLCLYTDGVTEVYDEGEEEFGLDRLIETVKSRRDDTAREIADEIVRRVRDFSALDSLPDDVTLVIVRVDKRASSK